MDFRLHIYIVAFRQLGVREGRRGPNSLTGYLAKIEVCSSAYPDFSFAQISLASEDALSAYIAEF